MCGQYIELKIKPNCKFFAIGSKGMVKRIVKPSRFAVIGKRILEGIKEFDANNK